MKGLIHVYTGDGKGKTSASLGLAVRARGAGKKVMFAQLFKKDSGEINALKQLGISFVQHSSSHPFFKKYTDDELKQKARECAAFVKNVFKETKKAGYDILIIDELGPALGFDLLREKDLIKMIKSRPEKTELVMTGRGFSEEIIKLADYVTEMKMIKHPFNNGVKARKGIEY